MSKEQLLERLRHEVLQPAREALRAEGINASPWQAIRWCRQGSHGHVLEALRVGHKWLSTRAAVRRWIDRQNIATDDTPRTRRGQRPTATKRASRSYLDSIGLRTTGV